jgi:hypothetical protein
MTACYGAISLLALAVLAVALPAAAADPVTIAMEDCKVSGPPKITGDISLLRLLFSGPPKEELVKRGTADVNGQKYTVYLPKAKPYTIENTGPADSGFENTSTLLYVDHDGDGRLTEVEGWFANLPVRLGDAMFDVAEIAADGSRVVLKPSKAPLRGVIVGRSCPPFAFKTADGQEVSRESLAGTAFLLDIWSIT